MLIQIQEIFPRDSVILQYLSLLFFMKMWTLTKVSKRMMNRFQISYEWKGIKDLTILIFVIVFITHLAACGWYYVGNISPDGRNWIKEQGIHEQTPQIQYVTSFYWAIVTVMTVGYGDITPQNNGERFFSLWVVLFGCMILPYSINSIGLIIQDIQRDKIRFE